MTYLSAETWQRLLIATQTHRSWHNRLLEWHCQPRAHTLHLVILREPYLSYILRKRKSIESRFGRDRRLPFGHVQAGDILLLKRAGGPLAGLALVDRAISQAITPTDVNEIRLTYAAELAIDDPAFWEQRLHSRYVTLIWLREVYPLPAIPLPRRDRRGWVPIWGVHAMPERE